MSPYSKLLIQTATLKYLPVHFIFKYKNMASGTQNKLLNYSIKTDVQMPYMNYKC